MIYSSVNLFDKNIHWDLKFQSKMIIDGHLKKRKENEGLTHKQTDLSAAASCRMSHSSCGNQVNQIKVHAWTNEMLRLRTTALDDIKKNEQKTFYC